MIKSSDISFFNIRSYMKNIIASFIFFILAAILSACSSVPDYASKPKLSIDKISLAQKDNVAGFNIDLTIYHRSTRPLKLEAVKSNIFMNNKLASNYLYTFEDKNIDNLKDVKLNIFIPANALSANANQVLVHNPLLVTQVSCALTLVFFDGDEANSFNPAVSYEGFVSYE